MSDKITEAVRIPSMTRDENGQLVRDMGNPHGLGPMLSADERAHRLVSLIETRDTAAEASARLEEVKARAMRPVGAEPQVFVYWWQEEVR